MPLPLSEPKRARRRLSTKTVSRKTAMMMSEKPVVSVPRAKMTGVVTLVHTDRHFDEDTQTWEDVAAWAARHAEAIEAAKQF